MDSDSEYTGKCFLSENHPVHLLQLQMLRRELHANPELSDCERDTAARVAEHLARLRPDDLRTGLGGHGLACVFEGSAPGPTVLFRAELDALPIDEPEGLPHRSTRPGVAHKCGHDGHLTILAGLAARLAARRPQRGRAVLVCQPAEETGAGARRVAADSAFADLRPDFAFALHNLPGFPLRTVVLREGTFTCASRGVIFDLHGRESHAAHPEQGLSPAPAVARLLAELPGLPARLPAGDFALLTLVHAKLGEEAYGTSPGSARVAATLRAETDARLEELAARADELARKAAADAGLDLRTAITDDFAATVNAPEAVEHVRAAAAELVFPVRDLADPIRWSEDFGALALTAHTALLGLGAGEEHPGLHRPEYDFPDALLEPGVALFEGIARRLLAAS